MAFASPRQASSGEPKPSRVVGLDLENGTRRAKSNAGEDERPLIFDRDTISGRGKIEHIELPMGVNGGACER